MPRPPVFPVDEKLRIGLSILAGDVSVAEAARRAKVAGPSVGKWKRPFLESGRARLAAGMPTARFCELVRSAGARRPVLPARMTTRHLDR